MLVEHLDEGDVKRRNRNTYLRQAEFFSSWCSRLGIKDATLNTIPSIHRERILLSYALEISQGDNLKGLKRIGVKTVQNYLRAAASHATDNSLRDPRYRYSPSGLPLDGSKFFPALNKLMSHMSKWSEGRDEALPLTTPIIQALARQAHSDGVDSEAACIFDAICLGLQTGSRCSEYCRGSPTDPKDIFSKVHASVYAGPFAGYPIAFTPEDFTFLSSSSHFLSLDQAWKHATYVRVRFRFDKGGTGNIQERTFLCFPPPRASFCPLLAVLRVLTRWSHFHLESRTPVFCYRQGSKVVFLHDSTVTRHLRAATVAAYPNPSHLYRTRTKDVRTHSVRVIACLILVVAKLSDATVEHRLRWASTAWKVYVRESLHHVSQAASSAFFTALSDSSAPAALNLAPQAFDADDAL